MTTGVRRSPGLMSYAWCGPLQIEWGDGVVLRFGQRHYIALRFRIR